MGLAQVWGVDAAQATEIKAAWPGASAQLEPPEPTTDRNVQCWRVTTVPEYEPHSPPSGVHFVCCLFLLSCVSCLVRLAFCVVFLSYTSPV